MARRWEEANGFNGSSRLARLMHSRVGEDKRLCELLTEARSGQRYSVYGVRVPSIIRTYKPKAAAMTCKPTKAEIGQCATWD